MNYFSRNYQVYFANYHEIALKNFLLLFYLLILFSFPLEGEVADETIHRYFAPHNMLLHPNFYAFIEILSEIIS